MSNPNHLIRCPLGKQIKLVVYRRLPTVWRIRVQFAAKFSSEQLHASSLAGLKVSTQTELKLSSWAETFSWNCRPFRTRVERAWWQQPLHSHPARPLAFSACPFANSSRIALVLSEPVMLVTVSSSHTSQIMYHIFYFLFEANVQHDLFV